LKLFCSSFEEISEDVGIFYEKRTVEIEDGKMGFGLLEGAL